MTGAEGMKVDQGSHRAYVTAAFKQKKLALTMLSCFLASGFWFTTQIRHSHHHQDADYLEQHMLGSSPFYVSNGYTVVSFIIIILGPRQRTRHFPYYYFSDMLFKRSSAKVPTT